MKFKLGLNHIEGYQVFIDTLNVRDKKYEDHLFNFLSLTSGIACIDLSEDMIATIKKTKVSGALAKEIIAAWYNIKPGKVVIGIQEFLDHFTTAEKKAILYHELGHLTLDHEFKERMAEEDRLVLEHEADMFAVGFTSKKTVKNAINKAPKVLMELLNQNRFKLTYNPDQIKTMSLIRKRSLLLD